MKDLLGVALMLAVVVAAVAAVIRSGRQHDRLVDRIESAAVRVEGALEDAPVTGIDLVPVRTAAGGPALPAEAQQVEAEAAFVHPEALIPAGVMDGPGFDWLSDPLDERCPTYAEVLDCLRASPRALDAARLRRELGLVSAALSMDPVVGRDWLGGDVDDVRLYVEEKGLDPDRILPPVRMMADEYEHELGERPSAGMALALAREAALHTVWKILEDELCDESSLRSWSGRLFN